MKVVKTRDEQHGTTFELDTEITEEIWEELLVNLKQFGTVIPSDEGDNYAFQVIHLFSISKNDIIAEIEKIDV